MSAKTELGSDQLTQRPRRKTRRFTAEQRQQIVAESFAAGASVREVAARYGVHAYQLSTWRSESATKKTSATTAETIRFAAVRSLPADGDGVIEIDISSSCILARGEVSASMLREVVELIR